MTCIFGHGQIVSQVEDGETIAYQCDSLKRLISATASGSMTWAQTYGYDGFGNLLSKAASGNGGGGPVSASYTINSATNRPFSGYTAAGLPTNSGFDNDNRMMSTVSTTGYSEYFAYSPGGKRVWNLGTRQIDQFTQGSVQEVWFWSPQGQRLAFYSLTHAGAAVFTFQEANVYLGGKLVGQYNSAGAHILKTSDRLGSFGKYYPYGEERNPTGASGEKFATYFHDNVVGLNYADQRWHANSGRFLTPDPSKNNVRPIDSQTWNMYLYTNGDPLNQIDTSGLGFMSWLRGVFGGGGAGGSGNGGATGTGDGTIHTEMVDQDGGGFYTEDFDPNDTRNVRPGDASVTVTEPTITGPRPMPSRSAGVGKSASTWEPYW